MCLLKKRILVRVFTMWQKPCQTLHITRAYFILMTVLWGGNVEIPLCRRGKGHSERLSNLLKVTQLLSGGAGNRTWSVWPRSPAHSDDSAVMGFFTPHAYITSIWTAPFCLKTVVLLISSLFLNPPLGTHFSEPTDMKSVEGSAWLGIWGSPFLWLFPTRAVLEKWLFAARAILEKSDGSVSSSVKWM